MLVATGLHCGYGTTIVLREIDLALRRGEMVALLGRNGCGKSTLIRCLGGALAPSAGSVTIDGTQVARHDRRALARRLAVVAQELRGPFAFSVREVVELGRAPHARFLAPSSAEDRRAVDLALHTCDLTDFADRTFQELSGGEQQRVALAMALAQEPEILLLDEPTVHLDLAHQVSLLALVRRLCAERGLAVLAAMHDINLSALYFDRITILGGGSMVASGTPGDVVTAPLIEGTFGTRVTISEHPTAGVPQVLLIP
ncbi:MAG: transporter [Chloroflexi bacterium]|nr:transporter [Chloroflexota bacterium]